MAKKVVIVGGGFGGFDTVRLLLKKGIEVTLISDKSYFTFTPLLVEVSTGSLCSRDVSFRMTDFFKDPKFNFILGRVDKIDFDSKTVYFGPDSIQYDYLVLAMGSRNRPINIPGVENAYHLKTLNDATRLKKIITEKQKNSTGPLNISIIGGGPTGIEFLFAIIPFLKELNPKRKHNFRLFEANSQLLPLISDNIRNYVYRLIKKHRVQLYANCRVQQIGLNYIKVNDEQIESDFTLLAAGVVPNTSMIDPRCCNEFNNVMVDEYLHLKNFETVFAVGDIIHMENMQIPKLAQTASDQAKYVAGNIESLINNKKLKPYKFHIKGRLLSLGGSRAAAQIGWLTIKGRFAHLLRSGFYVYRMPGLEYKVNLATSWLLHTIFAHNIKK